jgi:hypothetical protein
MLEVTTIQKCGLVHSLSFFLFLGVLPFCSPNRFRFGPPSAGDSRTGNGKSGDGAINDSGATMPDNAPVAL